MPLSSLASEITGELITDPYQRALWSTDASLYQIQPQAVLLPKSAADVAAAHRWATREKCSIIPRGSGTSLSGQSIGAGLVIDFSKHMNRILELDPQRATARVQPGVVLDQINAAAKPHGLQFGPDVATSSRANLGGMLGNNSAGSRSIFQGKMVDHLIELDCTLADGSPATFRPMTPAEVAAKAAEPTLEGAIYRTFPQIIAREKDEVLARFPRILRRVSGYNLDEFIPETRAWFPTPSAVARVRAAEEQRYPGATMNLSRLIAGAEGTLATVHEMLVHLVPLPKCRGLVVLHFDSIRGAVSTVPAALAAGASAVELFDKKIIELARESLEYKHYLDFVVGSPETLLIVEFAGGSADEVARQIAQFETAITGTPDLSHLLTVTDPAQCDKVWACRKASLPLLMGVPGVKKPVAFVEDTAVPPERLPEFVSRFRQIMHNHGTDGSFYGHASVGCLHIRPALDTGSRADLVHLRQISEEVCALVMEFGGSMSGEHGDGLARSYLNERLFGPRLYQAFRDVKAAFDPAGLLNPGKIVEGPDPTENLRTRSDQGPWAERGQGSGVGDQPASSVSGKALAAGGAPVDSAGSSAEKSPDSLPTLARRASEGNPGAPTAGSSSSPMSGKALAAGSGLADSVRPEEAASGRGLTPDPRPLTPASSLPLVFDWHRQGGFAQAVDLCNGAGVCRKTQTGTMCPSFMATGDEEHSTRGRANALRQVLSGALPPAELTGQKLFDTFSLCLQCKGCKAECPSNVDVGKMKAEFLQLYHNQHGAPLSARLMGHVHELNRWGSFFAPLSNWLPRLPGAAYLQQLFFGVDHRRPLPVFHRDHFVRWFARRSASSVSGKALAAGNSAPSSASAFSSSPSPQPLAPSPSPVILLADCLTSYCEPHVNRSAVLLLESLGYTVHLAGLACCGRAMISKGLLYEARQLARANVRHLIDTFPTDVPILGTEPSCILTLADDYRDLVPGAEAERIAARSELIDSFLVRTGAIERLGVGTRDEGRETSNPDGSSASLTRPSPLDSRLSPVLLHGHCHQKALVGVSSTRALLERAGYTVQVVDSGCCGMAGSFGYEHYDLSMKIGERVLFPAVRKHCGADCAPGVPPAGLVVAPGFSCRHQIEHGTGARAKHPVEVALDALHLQQAGSAR